MAHSRTFFAINVSAAGRWLLPCALATVMTFYATAGRSVEPFEITSSVGPVPLTSVGAKCNGDGANADRDTAAAKAVANSGRDLYLPTNNFCVFNAPIKLTKTGQRILGDGPQASKVLIFNVFGSGGKGSFEQGVFNLEAPAQEVRGVGLSFNQPEKPNSRSDLTTYQPAIRAHQSATVLDDLLITGATTCIDMGGNSNAGNSYITDVGTGCYDYGIRLDGSVDTVHVRMHHHFPFAMNAIQSALFQRPENIAIDMGRVDDFAIDQSLCLGTTCLNFYEGAQGTAFGTVTNYDFDGAANGILMQANGSLVGSALTFSSGSSTQHAITQRNGRIIISGSSFFAAKPTILDQFSGGLQTISASEWNQIDQDAPAIVSQCHGNTNLIPITRTATPCRLTLVGNTVERDPSKKFQNAWLESTGDEVVIGSSNSITNTDKGGIFISLAKDSAGNRWFGNSSPGWRNILAGETMPNNSLKDQLRGRYFAN